MMRQRDLVIVTSRFARSATSPSFAYVSNPAPEIKQLRDHVDGSYILRIVHTSYL